MKPPRRCCPCSLEFLLTESQIERHLSSCSPTKSYPYIQDGHFSSQIEESQKNGF